MDETIKVKLRLLNSFLEGAFDKVQRDGRFDLVGTIDAFDAAGNQAGLPELAQTTKNEPSSEALQFLFSNPQFADDFEAKYGGLPPNFQR